MKRTATWLGALLVIVAMPAGLGLGLWRILFPEKLTIVSFFLRDPAADSIENGIELALEECGHRAGRFRLVEERRDIRPSGDVYEGLEEEPEAAIQNPQTVALIGTSNDFSYEIVRRLNEAGLLMIAPDERSPELTKPGYGTNDTPERYRPTGELNFFRVLPADDVFDRGCAEWAWKSGARSVLLLGGDYRQARKDAFYDRALKLGMKVLGRMADSSLYAYEGERDPSDQIRELNPDLLFIRGNVSAGFSLARQARKKGWTGKILTDAVNGEHLSQSPSPTFDGVFLASRAAPPPDFERLFTARFGHSPDNAAYYGYLAVRTIVESIEQAGSKDRDSIRRACARLPRFDASGDTLFNDLDFATLKEGRVSSLERFVPSRAPSDPPKPVLTISFEGSDPSLRWIGWGTLRAHSMRGTFYIDQASIDASDQLSWRDLRDLDQGGNEIAVGVDPSLARSQWVPSAQLTRGALDRERIQPSPSFGCPTSPGSEVGGELGGLGFQWLWAVGGDPLHGTPLAPGEYSSHAGGKGLEELKALVDRALAEKKHVDLRFRRFPENEAKAGELTREEFEALCTYIDSKGFMVVPARELYQGFRAGKGRP